MGENSFIIKKHIKEMMSNRAVWVNIASMCIMIAGFVWVIAVFVWAAVGAKGYDNFGFNSKSQIIKLILFAGISFAAALIIKYRKEIV